METIKDRLEKLDLETLTAIREQILTAKGAADLLDYLDRKLVQ